MVEEGVASAEGSRQGGRARLRLRFAVLGLLEFIDWGSSDIPVSPTRLSHRERWATKRFTPRRRSSKRNMHENNIGMKTRV